ncbi:MAG: beta-propeller domain-containing protein [Candidatus Shapirobacteria bacterium]
MKKIYWLLIVMVALAVGLTVWQRMGKSIAPPVPKSIEEIKSFQSEAEFQEYLAKARQLGTGALGMGQTMNRLDMASEGVVASAPRVSETNVQVKGIDEPDIVKTDGKNIYLSSQSDRVYLQMMPPYPLPEAKTRIIQALSPEKLAQLSQIDLNGELLLAKDTLIILGEKKITAWNVNGATSPQQKWQLEIKENHQTITARLFQDKIYLVGRDQINDEHPCLLEPLKGQVIDCVQIYHPVEPAVAEVVYSLMVIDPLTGKVEKSLALLGSSGHSVTYFSGENWYLTYPRNLGQSEITLGFFATTGRGLISAGVWAKLQKLQDYDLSDQAKQVEIQEILRIYQNDLKWQNDFNNRMQNYSQEHQREWEKTGIVKIALTSFQVNAAGSVPGQLLNQFALDEYQNYLRVATTVGNNANDVYVLDQKLKIAGQIVNLGLTERIYAVRFINDKGYLVTFRQTDPFYVLDLSDPAKPVKKGELKIPGYSGYLHPLAKNLILGIGKEGNEVKVSLFDVSSSADPLELDKYLLQEYDTEILQTHHAFLQDEKHQIFFVPGNLGGYVFGYQGNRLELLKAVKGNSIRRALYLDDYLYLVGEREITAFSEIDWQEIGKLSW